MCQCIQHIFRILCKMTEESFDNVSINSEDISVSTQDEWYGRRMVTPMNQLIIN